MITIEALQALESKFAKRMAKKLVKQARTVKYIEKLQARDRKLSVVIAKLQDKSAALSSQLQQAKELNAVSVQYNVVNGFPTVQWNLADGKVIRRFEERKGPAGETTFVPVVEDA